jgi:hypothetical protein
MRYLLPCAAAAAMIGASFVGGCASKRELPASPVPVILSDTEAARIANAHLSEDEGFATRQPASMEPTGDGYLVEYRTAFAPDEKAPRQSRLVKVEHDGDVREIDFREGK